MFKIGDKVRLEDSNSVCVEARGATGLVIELPHEKILIFKDEKDGTLWNARHEHLEKIEGEL